MAEKDEGLLDPSEIEALFGAIPSGTAKGASAPDTAAPAPPSTGAGASPSTGAIFQVQPFQLPELAAVAPNREEGDVGLIADVDLNVRIELGRTRMYVEDVLRLREGSIVPLEKLAGDPVDIFVNGQLLARGEVLVLNDNFCVRVSEVIGDKEFEGRAEAS